MNSIDFINTFEEEFARAVTPFCSEVVPADGYDIYYRAFSQDPSRENLENLSASDFERLKQAAQNFLEVNEIPLSAIRQAITRTLHRTRRLDGT